MKLGIIGYGAYIPCYRIAAEKIAQENYHDWKKIQASLCITEKSVPARDEDAITLAVTASKNALKRAQIDPRSIGVVYVGSESHPYVVKPSASVVSAALGVSIDHTAADIEFACKAGTAALQAAYAQVKSGFTQCALAIGSDTAQASERDLLEYTAGAAAAAFLLGTENIIASIDGMLSVTSDTPDFWRRGLQKFPEHVGRFTAEPGYFSHIQLATRNILKKLELQPQDFAYVVFHQPNSRFPLSVAAKLGFNKKQVEPGLLVTQVGNSYSASSMLGLTAVLDQAEAGDKILLVSYGSGSGCDAFVLTTTENLAIARNRAPITHDYVQRKMYVSYANYRRNLDLIY